MLAWLGGSTGFRPRVQSTSCRKPTTPLALTRRLAAPTFEVAASVDFENRAGATEIAILAPKRDGLKNNGHLLRT